MAKKKKDISEIVKELIVNRDRTGKAILTPDERIRLLDEIYDGLLYLWKECVLRGTATGTGAIGNQLERARLELESWGGSADKGMEIFVKGFRGFDLSASETDSDADA